MCQWKQFRSSCGFGWIPKVVAETRAKVHLFWMQNARLDGRLCSNLLLRFCRKVSAESRIYHCDCHPAPKLPSMYCILAFSAGFARYRGSIPESESTQKKHLDQRQETETRMEKLALSFVKGVSTLPRQSYITQLMSFKEIWKSWPKRPAVLPWLLLIPLEIPFVPVHHVLCCAIVIDDGIPTAPKSARIMTKDCVFVLGLLSFESCLKMDQEVLCDEWSENVM